MTAPVVEFTDLGRCPECNQSRWRAAMCACGHEVYLHDLGKRKGVTVRTNCSVMDGSGHCECRMFTEAPV